MRRSGPAVVPAVMLSGWQAQGEGEAGLAGYRLDFSTYLGGSGWEHVREVFVDREGNVYIAGGTASTDFPTSPGAHDRTFNAGGRQTGGFGACDVFVSKFSPEGQLVWSTLLGGPNYDRAYVTSFTSTGDFPTTAGAFQRTFGGGRNDIGVVKVGPTGALVAGTLVGGSGAEGSDGISVDDRGNVFVTGSSSSPNFPVTRDAYQTSRRGSRNAVLFLLSADFSRLLYCTYMGGKSEVGGRTGFMDGRGDLYVAGFSSGPGWPLLNPCQDRYGGGKMDNVLAKFRRLP